MAAAADGKRRGWQLRRYDRDQLLIMFQAEPANPPGKRERTPSDDIFEALMDDRRDMRLGHEGLLRVVRDGRLVPDTGHRRLAYWFTARWIAKNMDGRTAGLQAHSGRLRRCCLG
jgi:hypothetical protein